MVLAPLLWDFCTWTGLYPARPEYSRHFTNPFNTSAQRHDPVTKGNLSISFVIRTYSLSSCDRCKSRRRKGNVQCRKRTKHIHRLLLREKNLVPLPSGNLVAKYFAKLKPTNLFKSLRLLICIREMLGSNLGWNNDYSENFCILPHSPDEYWYITLKLGHGSLFPHLLIH